MPLADIARELRYQYLLGYSPPEKGTGPGQLPSVSGEDLRWHTIQVRVKRRDVEVRARKGFWALTPADVERVKNPTPDVAKPVQTALASIAPSVQAGKYVRTWIGTEKGSNGKTRVTLVWEPLPQTPGSAATRCARWLTGCAI